MVVGMFGNFALAPRQGRFDTPNYSAYFSLDDEAMVIELTDDDADEIRDLCGDRLVEVGFDERSESNRTGYCRGIGRQVFHRMNTNHLTGHGANAARLVYERAGRSTFFVQLAAPSAASLILFSFGAR